MKSKTLPLNPNIKAIEKRNNIAYENVFNRFLSLYVYDLNKKSDKGINHLIWSIVANSLGSEIDLDEVFPILVEGSQDFFGNSTKGVLSRRVYVKTYRGIYVRN